MSEFAGGAGRIVLLGGGNMGGAMARGWIGYGVSPTDIHIVDPRPSAALQDFLASTRVGHSPGVPDARFDVAVVAVKPQTMADALPALAAALHPQSLVISVAAGTTVATIEGLIGPMAIVRAMPNTPALIGRGITGAYATVSVDADLRDKADALLSASGAVIWVDAESDIDAVTAVSGSGPAYVFHLAEAMATAGEALGLSPETAMTLARHTVAGAGELMIRSAETPAQLRRNVTSPNGTTQAALDVLMSPEGLCELMLKAVTAARDRARELSRG